MNFLEFKQTLNAQHIVINEEQILQFKKYLNFLQEWNKVMDLTAIDEYEAIIEKHFYDCLLSSLAVNFTNQTLLDIGSGAGFPGLVLKIAYPNLNVTLLEPTNKRCKFLNAVINDLNLTGIKVINKRAEEYINENQRETYDIVTSRAVSRLNILLELSVPFLKKDGYMLALKGKNVDDEINDAKNALILLDSEIVQCLRTKLPSESENRTILLIKKNKKTPIRYPRNYGSIKKKPL